MAHMSLTALRNKLFKVVGGVVGVGIPVEIERNNHKLLIVLKEKKSKLDNLKLHDCIIGDPDDLVNLKVTEWDEVNNL